MKNSKQIKLMEFNEEGINFETAQEVPEVVECIKDSAKEKKLALQMLNNIK